MGISKVFFGGKMAAWRTRKQVAWIAVLLTSLCFLYDHMIKTPQMSLQTEDSQTRRSLHSLDEDLVNEREKKPMDEPNERVTFVSVDESGKSEVTGMKDDKFLNEVQTIEDDIFTQKRHKKALDILERRIREQTEDNDITKGKNSNAQETKVEEPFDGGADRSNNIYGGNAAAAWNGGSFKYNPYGEPVYDHGNRPNYIPKERMVHLDLKGAPPLVSVYRTLIPWLAKYGATSILMEYEDMFPWEGSLSPFAAKNHYTKEDIKEILSLCKENNIDLIPLVQTFGHLEFALKLPNFSHLREVPEIPQALCPSLSDSQVLVQSMIDQMLSLHPHARYLHIGCDEVFQMGECDRCRIKTKENLFLDHVSKTAKYVRAKYGIMPLIWHDMLTHVSESAMKEYNIGDLVEPVVWVYAEDVYRFVQPSMWTKLSQIFPSVWAASAFKGAFGEQSTVPNVRRHLDNNQNWLDVMSSEGPKFLRGFRGIVLTGWQRHDHFAVLCELLPSALPSLAINLLTTSHGYFNDTVYPKLYEALKCMQTPKYQTRLDLDTDPFLWDKFSWCFFPGALIFKSTARLDAMKRDVRSYIERVTLKRAWITDYNRRHNFSSPMRIDEDLEELPSRLHSVTLLIKSAKEALSEWFDDWTVGEWIEQHIWPSLNELETLQRESENMKAVRTWPVRPLPLLSRLQEFDIHEPKDQPSFKTTTQYSRSFDLKKKQPRTIHLI